MFLNTVGLLQLIAIILVSARCGLCLEEGTSQPSSTTASNTSFHDSNLTVVDADGRGAVAGFLEIDLEAFENGEEDFVKRKVISNHTLERLPTYDISVNSIHREPGEMYTLFHLRRLKLYWGLESCVRHTGRIGHLYYQFWAIEGKCYRPNQVKAISGAMDKAMRLENNNFLTHNWCVKLIHRGRWSGIVVFGPTPEAKEISCKDVVNQEDYEHSIEI